MAESKARRIARIVAAATVLWVGMYYGFAAAISEQGLTWAFLLMVSYYPVVLLSGFLLAWLMPQLLWRLAVVFGLGLAIIVISASMGSDLAPFNLIALFWALVFQLIVWGKLPRADDRANATQES